MLKDLSDTITSLGGALDVLDSSNALSYILTLKSRFVSRWVENVGMACTINQPIDCNTVTEGQELIGLTCSGDTGFWLVLCSSSIVLASKRRSFLHPTRMMGRPEQK
jgi:hypothetical protein